ncbi:TRAP transporter substrate-binding protein [Xinfangfangia sp. CPCC 101601]|uniref:TRAP transporter substrate-binding protein n=1 Tax=Pseudogemmobacter lacusdianii TaxID=3069608 RepID=A0ABU0VSZ6_9RHOB|nr:TRAP transporter substrate-binding protein [Xinfangfangia sp. CPCC 101601]MDQ2064841.1 TRAP transporter substrate-binding protein [Xinfangfangia sp. CPCC 101601]
MKKTLRAAFAAVTLMGTAAGFGTAASAEEAIVLHGASAYTSDHIFNRAMAKFTEKVTEYYGKPVEFVMHENGELGNEASYFTLMARGTSVDFAVVAPAHLTQVVKSAGVLDTPFLFRDTAHWKKAIEQNAFGPVIEEIETKGRVKVLGLGGGAERNILSNKPATNLEELAGLRMRVQGTPIHATAFGAIGIEPSVIAYNEIYNAIQSGVIDALENEASTNAQMRFYEVAPEVIRTSHIVTVRPLLFSSATLERLPEDLQAAILKAGEDAAAFWRETETAEDVGALEQLAAENKLRIHTFTDLEKMHELVVPAVDAYAEELGAADIIKAVRAIE